MEAQHSGLPRFTDRGSDLGAEVTEDPALWGVPLGQAGWLPSLSEYRSSPFMNVMRN